MTHQIELENVEKHYGSFHALKTVNLSIPKGQFVALVGPSWLRKVDPFAVYCRVGAHHLRRPAHRG